MDVRNRQEEIAYLRDALSRHREDLDQQRRLNVCLKERKVRGDRILLEERMG